MSCSNSLKLPAEIWYKIFALLPTDDLNNIRLTCRHFYELCYESGLQTNAGMVFRRDSYQHFYTLLCNENGAQANEKMIVRRDPDTNPDSPFNLLSSGSRRIQNIRLVGIDIRTTTLPFFEKKGPNIRSLILERCRFDPGVFAAIMEHCTTLHSIILILEFWKLEYFQNVIEDMQTLSDKAITFKQVVNLELTVRGCHRTWTNQTFLPLMALFPNVQRVDLELGDVDFTSPDFYDWLIATRNQLEKLRFHFNFKYGEVQQTFEMVGTIAQIEMKNLKELSLKCMLPLSLYFAPNPFLPFRNVTELDCFFLAYSSSVTLAVLLNSLPRLRSLTYGTRDTIYMSKQCFEAVIKSKLTRLEIRGEVSIQFNKSSVDSNLQPNYHLKNNPIEAFGNHNFQLLFTYYCRCFESLTFVRVDEDTLHHIFKYQNNLRTLKLCNRRETTSIKGARNFINYKGYNELLQNAELLQYRLHPHLTHLQIEDDEVYLTNFLLGKFKFPQLQSLNIRILEYSSNKEEHKKQFWQILSTMTQLESLSLSKGLKFSFPQLLHLVQSLQNLRHLDITACLVDGPLTPSQCFQLLSACSSLRTITDISMRCSYDVPTKTIRTHTFSCQRSE